jgi:hypothetical protein
MLDSDNIGLRAFANLQASLASFDSSNISRNTAADDDQVFLLYRQLVTVQGYIG